MAQVQQHYENPFGDLLDLSFVDEMQMDGNEVELPPPAPQDHITVFVSGRTFYIIPSLFDQVQGLPWYQVGGLYHLDAEADLFEVILQFYLMGALPSKTLLKKRRASLQQLVAPLENAMELQMCVNGNRKKASSRSTSTTLPSSAGNKRGLSLRNMNKKNHHPSEATKKSKGFFSFKSKKMQSKPFDDLDDSSDSIISGALSQVTQATTITTLSEKENPKKRQKGLNHGWNKIMNHRSAKREMIHQSLRSEYIV
eukprot:CAMPEP_0113634218 /NCGR_PEP_ID=MMETSP0017_2-20120614/17815_1 /TAXON_ID=2856 /ORGANISM="Cylindrotheca closterium" /LENGTH=253 /DNA_ID=CAMNT_0000544903 /DNA_START=66 /DNA_END=827 /DNA_ORIENTATION=+ /assembly_acc=CAM_ASM_000147